jgi:hypothetical protein
MKPWNQLTLSEKTKYALKHRLTLLPAGVRYTREYNHYQTIINYQLTLKIRNHEII